MADRSDELEVRRVYFIPENFTEGGSMILGLFHIRYVVEGIIMAIPGAIAALKMPLGLQGTIIALCVMAVPALALGCIGINGDCVSKFFIYFFKFRKTRRVIRYNPRVKLEYTGEYQLSRSELPRDKILKMLANLNEKGKDVTESDRYFATESNIAFEDDIQLEKRLIAKARQRGQ